MERIIKSTSIPRGYMSETQRLFMKDVNENPTFDPTTKPYHFIKAVKTKTDVHGWIFEYNGEVFVATQKLPWRGGEQVDIYTATEKGSFNHTAPVATMLFYCDVEAAVDKWIIEKDKVLDGES